jgi:peroxiredoxin (alkyl hydroperoxide reductase subunit C)
MKKYLILIGSVVGLGLMVSCAPNTVASVTPDLRTAVYRPGKLKPIDSVQKLKVGDKAPDFTLPVVDGKTVTLSHYRGKKNVVISFVPAAFTPVCSKQWPGYNISLEIFKQNDAELLGITTDNVPSLHAWIQLMGGVQFKALSDFWPHGKVASSYGVLRSNGVCERAIVVIDKKGVIRFIKVYDINKRPALDDIANALKRL